MDGLLLGHVRGIEIRLPWSVGIIVALLAWSLAEVMLPEMEPGYGTSAYWFAAVLGAIALFASLLAHELGHSLAAGREGITVSRINLWLFGGIAQLTTAPTNPASGMRIAFMGPLVSLLVGMFGLGLSSVVDGLAGGAIFWFGIANISLAVFNMLPALPLDGGRIYQAWQWHRLGDAAAATRRAAAVGLAVGAALIGIGAIEMLLGGTIGGVWLMFIGLFIRDAARHEVAQSEIEAPLEHIHVEHVMTRDPEVIDPDMALDVFLATVFFGGRHATYPVGKSSDDIIGIITLNTLRQQPSDDLSLLHVRDIVTPLQSLLCVAPGESLGKLAGQIASHPHARALVFEGPTLVGIVSPGDVTRMLSIIEIASPTLHTAPSRS